TMTEAYQLAPGAPPNGDLENKLWSRFRLTPMGPEELLNALLAATNVESTVRRAGGGRNLAQLRFQLVRQYSFLFDVDEDADRPNYEGTVSQALALLNGSLVGIGSRDVPGSALAGILDTAGPDAEKIEKIYLRTLSRLPSGDELEEWKKYVQAPPSGGA